MRIGIDLGGTKTEAILMDGEGAIVWRRRVATPAGDYRGSLAAIVDLVEEADRCGTTGAKPSIGIGIPGTIAAATGRVKNANSVWLNGQPLARDLNALLGREIRVANDANCFAMSEATDGAAAGAPSVMGVILGTGVGSGLVFEGRLVAGANGIGGEWGHNPLPRAADGADSLNEWPGPACYCGRRGCIETWLSGPALAADHLRVTGKQLDTPSIIAAMRSGDPAAGSTFERYVDRLARGLAGVVNIFDPHVIVLGGGLSNVDELYQQLPPQLASNVFSPDVVTRVVRNRHGDSSGVRGAAWLWPA